MKKRLFVIVLAAAMLLAPQRALAAPVIEDAEEDFVYFEDYNLDDEAFDEDDRTIDLGNIRPGHQLRLFVSEGYFSWDDYSPDYDPLQLSQVERQNLTIGREFYEGFGLIENISWHSYGRGAYIQINFAQIFAEVENTDISFMIYLNKDGDQLDYTEVDITATMRNPIAEVDHVTKSVDLSSGAVARVNETVSIPVYAGEGIMLHTTLRAGYRYYAKAVREVPPAGDELFTRYPALYSKYSLYTANFNGGVNIVSFDVPTELEVYNASHKLIGTTADTLPLSSAYYLVYPLETPGPEPEATPQENPAGGPVS